MYDGICHPVFVWPAIPTQVPSLEDNTPVYEEWDVPGDDINAAAQMIADRYISSGEGTQFMIFRSVLQSPTYHKHVSTSSRLIVTLIRHNGVYLFTKT